MAKLFDVSVESPVTVEQVFAALGDADYWRARLTAFGGGTATLDSLIVDQEGAVSVVVRVGLSRDSLPKLVTRLHNLTPEMVRNEKWSRMIDDRVQGEITVAFSGAPVSAVGEAFLVPVCNGSRLDYTTTIEVKAPLVGGKIETYLGGQLADGIIDIQRFTTAWIAEHG